MCTQQAAAGVCTLVKQQVPLCAQLRLADLAAALDLFVNNASHSALRPRTQWRQTIAISARE